MPYECCLTLLRILGIKYLKYEFPYRAVPFILSHNMVHCISFKRHKLWRLLIRIAFIVLYRREKSTLTYFWNSHRAPGFLFLF